MPASSTAIPRSFSLVTMAARLVCVSLGSMPAQRVVGAELHDDRVGIRIDRPVETHEGALRGIARHPGVVDRDVETAGAQGGLELHGKGILRLEARAGGQTVAQGDQPQRFGAGMRRREQSATARRTSVDKQAHRRSM